MGLESIPEAVKKLDRFVLWAYRMKKGRMTKPPFSVSGGNAAVNDPATWCAFETACSTFGKYPEIYNGIGIVLNEYIVGIDMDHVVEDGEITAKALEIIDEIPGYVEYSPSGTGLHILTRGRLPEDRDKIKFSWIEFYDETSPRYFTVTGNVYRDDDLSEDASDAVAYVYRRVRAAEGKDPLLEKIRRSKQGEKFAALFDRGEITKTRSEAVASLLAILAFWTGKNKAKMDELFRRSALYDAEKWNRPQNGRTLGEIEIDSACDFVKEAYGSAIEFPDVGERGAIRATIGNIETLFEHYKIKVCYDEIKKTTRYFFEGADAFSLDNYDNACYGHILSLCMKEDVSTAHFKETLATIIDKNRINPVQEWILSKPWDGRNRLRHLYDTLLTPCGYPYDLKEILMRKWFLSTVAAACYDPHVHPFMTRGVLVLAGKQYIGKSRWISSLAPRMWVKDGSLLDPNSKDSVTSNISFWIVELGELDSTFRRDIGKIKAFLTLETDRIRMPFAAKLSEFPRRTIFAASVNEPKFLVDKTGNSRFWTIPVERVDYNHKIDMQQVYAQLYLEWQQGEQWWLTSEENMRLAELNEGYETKNAVEYLLEEYYDWSNFDPEDWTNKKTSVEILFEIGFKERKDMRDKDFKDLSAFMRRKTKKEEGKLIRGIIYWPVPSKNIR